MLQRRLGWPEVGVTVLDLDVRSATDLQLSPVRRERGARLRVFYAEAGCSLAGVSAAEQEEAVLGWLSTVWALRWDNHRKEDVFRLTLDAFLSVRLARLTGAGCACGAAGPGREHAFWTCPIAAAVVEAVRQQLPQGVMLQREHFWLGRPPACSCPALNRGVWEVVAVAAVSAMAAGCKLLLAWEQGKGNPPPPLRAELRVRVAAQRAVLSFWAALQDFVSVQRGPRQWVAGVPLSHPFLQRCADEVALGLSRR
jgi:hypothetical protein